MPSRTAHLSRAVPRSSSQPPAPVSDVFHQMATAPPGRTTRTTSLGARSRSTQCHDWAKVTRSNESAAKGKTLASARTTWASGVRRRKVASICSPWSTATTWAPRPSSPRVEIPVPAPTSPTRLPLRKPPDSSSIASYSSSGYPGRPASYCRATASNRDRLMRQSTPEHAGRRPVIRRVRSPDPRARRPVWC
jgi:hypothetical protein